MLPMVLFLLSSENKNSLKEGYMEMANFYFLETHKKCPGSLNFTLLIWIFHPFKAGEFKSKRLVLT